MPVSLKVWRRALDRKVAALAAAQAQLRKERHALGKNKRRVRALLKAQALTQHVAERVQNKAHAQVSRIVTKCLETVFAEPYSFRLVFERKRSRTEARMVFERGGLEVDPTTASGGGVVLVAAFALRVAALVLSRPSRRRLLVLDEPFHFVSEDLSERVRELLETLSRELRVQIVLVTHNEQLRTGRVHAL